MSRWPCGHQPEPHLPVTGVRGGRSLEARACFPPLQAPAQPLVELSLRPSLLLRTSSTAAGKPDRLVPVRLCRADTGCRHAAPSSGGCRGAPCQARETGCRPEGEFRAACCLLWLSACLLSPPPHQAPGPDDRARIRKNLHLQEGGSSPQQEMELGKRGGQLAMDS